MPAGTRTAPVVDGNPTLVEVSVRFIDAVGDQGSYSQTTTAAAATPLNIEAFVAAFQATTAASVYAVKVSNVYNSNGDTGNASNAEFRSSMHDQLVFLLRNPATKQSFNPIIPAPINATLQDLGGGTFGEQVNATSTEIAAYLTALTTLVPNFDVIQARFTERLERNTAIKI